MREIRALKRVAWAGFGRRRRVVLAAGCLAVVAVCAAASAPEARHASAKRYRYPWPIVPFDRPHSIVGNFGEPRTTFFGSPRPGSLFGRGLFFFHNGIDVPAPADTPVYAVASGIADLPDPTVVRVRSSDGPTFEYWHIDPVVKPGQVVVARRTIVGRIRRKPGHVHVKEVAGGMVTNPLAPGGIGPSPDRTRPRIDTITFRRPGGRTLLPGHLGGRVFFVVDAVDPPGAGVEGPRRQMPLVPALITWRVERWDPLYDHWQRVVVIPTRIAVDFRSTLPHARDFWRVYARGTYQNAATFFRYHDSIGPGRYLFKLTPRAFDTHALADGTYDLVVTAGDIAGNRGSLRQRFTVDN